MRQRRSTVGHINQYAPAGIFIKPISASDVLTRTIDTHHRSVPCHPFAFHSSGYLSKPLYWTSTHPVRSRQPFVWFVFAHSFAFRWFIGVNMKCVLCSRFGVWILDICSFNMYRLINFVLFYMKLFWLTIFLWSFYVHVLLIYVSLKTLGSQILYCKFVLLNCLFISDIFCDQ